ncbi:hypothetical protein MMC25_008154 [Agyrium rufum]|nr:hypothetical protein [Agyrium rufum]
MRISVFALLVGLASCVAAANPEKQVIILFPKDTPKGLLDEAMNAVKAAGGTITHEYSLFKGFAAKTSTSVLETIQALSTEFVATIEEDQVVSVNEELLK